MRPMFDETREGEHEVLVLFSYDGLDSEDALRAIDYWNGPLLAKEGTTLVHSDFLRIDGETRQRFLLKFTTEEDGLSCFKHRLDCWPAAYDGRVRVEGVYVRMY